MELKQQLYGDSEGDSIWYDVGTMRSNTYSIKKYYKTVNTDEHNNTNLDNLPNYKNKSTIKIQPDTCYKLRVAGINACGRGEWSDISLPKINLPGYPDTPTSIKIAKALDGINLSWRAPYFCPKNVLKYSVCMAVKSLQKTVLRNLKPLQSNLYFLQLYCGPNKAITIKDEILKAALIDRTRTKNCRNRPAIIFRIAAINEIGCGPAAQVLWLGCNKSVD